MGLIIADTSIWIELLNNPSAKRMVPQEILYRLATCPPVIQEVLQGLRNQPSSVNVRKGLLALPCLAQTVPLDLYLKAAEIFATGRRRGYTIRSGVDCLIAAIAIESGVPIWHKDRDFDFIAKYTSLSVYEPPARG